MEQEISLREIIETVLKGKWIIITVTLSALLVSGIFSFFFIPPTYETNSLVRLQNSTEKDSTPLYLNSFAETLKSDSSINRILENLQLDIKEHSINSIREQIQLEVLRESGVMKIKVKGEETQLITDLANLLAYELGSRIEIAELSQDIVEIQKNLLILTDKITIAKSELSEAKKQLESTPEKQITKKAIIEDTLLESLIKESTNTSASDVAGLQMESETTNPIFNALQSRVADVTINLMSMQTEEQTLKSRIEKNTSKITILDQLLEKEKLSIKQADRLLNGNQAVFISPAIQPLDPVGPKKLFNMIIATILGAMLSLFFVFVKQYMQNTSKSLTSNG